MTSSERGLGRTRRRGGFTLVEALVAFAILVLATVGMIWSRSDAVKRAAESRNLRLAMKIARETLDRFEAGMSQRDIYELNYWQPLEEYPDFAVRVVTRTEDISDFEEDLAMAAEDEEGLRRLDLEERLRDARRYEESETRSGEGGTAAEDSLVEEEEQPIDEETLQDLVVGVRYPSFDLERYPDGRGVYILRTQLSTLALSGMTPEEAQEEQEETEGGAAGQPAPPGGGGR